MNNFFKATTLSIAATLAAGAASANTYWVEDGIHLNARSGPGTQYYAETTLKPCTKVEVVGQKWGWAKISYNYQTYWVSAKYLQDYKCGYKAPKKTYQQPTYKQPKTYNNDY